MSKDVSSSFDRRRVARPPYVLGLTLVGVFLLLVAVTLFALGGDKEKFALLAAALGVAATVVGWKMRPRDGIGAEGRLRRTVLGSLALWQALVVFLLLCCVYFIGYKHRTKWDLTKEGIYTLSEETTKLLESMNKDVTVYCFFTKSPSLAMEKQKVQDLLSEYGRVSGGRLKWKMIDPDSDPRLTRQYKVVRDGTVIFECEGKRIKVEKNDEEGLTNALKKALKPGKKTILALAGHGELTIDSGDMYTGMKEAADALRQDQYEIKPLYLFREREVPSECDVLLVAGPQSALQQDEIEKIEHYLESGGSLVVMLDPTCGEGNDSLKDLLKKWGVRMDDGIVVEPDIRLMLMGQSPVVCMVTDFADHEITRSLKNFAAVFSTTCGVEGTKDCPAELTVTRLARTSPSSWLETDARTIKFDAGKDKKGPICVAVAVEKNSSPGGKKDGGKGRSTRIVVFGDRDFVSNQLINRGADANFLQNAVNWASGEEDLIAIKKKTLENTALELSEGDEKVIYTLTVFVYPAMFMFVGAVIYFLRRSL